MIVPPALDVAPLRVAESLIGLPIVTEFVALVVKAAQLLIVTACGGTKSFRAAVNESDERLLR